MDDDEFTLTAADRCDGCGSRAYWRFVQPDLRELLFCAHHGTQYRGKFPESIIFDETGQLLVKLDASPA